MPAFLTGTGTNSGQREYVVSQNVPDNAPMTCNVSPTTAPTGVATPIELSSNTTDPAIPVGKCPVFGVQTPDLQRLYILNRGDSTLTVINTRNNTPDACTPFQNQNGAWITCHPTIQLPAGSGPVTAEYNAATDQLVVANYDGGTISVVNVPLDEYGNDSNTYTNSNCTTYAACGAVTGGFGTVTTIKVGNTATPNPASVTVLADGSKAYSANQNDDSGTGNGTVTVVNLHTYTVEKTLTVEGHPRTIVNTQNSEFAKVYTASPDSPFITIIESSPTVTDLIDTTVLLEGTPVDIRTTTQTGSAAITTTAAVCRATDSRVICPASLHPRERKRFCRPARRFRNEPGRPSAQSSEGPFSAGERPFGVLARLLKSMADETKGTHAQRAH